MEPAPKSTNNPKLAVFISYSSADIAFVNKLVATLEAANIDVLIDRRNLPFGEKFKPELVDFVRRSDAVVFVVSPRSITSPWCTWEIEQVNSQSKRLVPIVLEQVPIRDLPADIADIHMLPFMDAWDGSQELTESFSARTAILTNVLLTDHEWVKEHTRLGQLAHRWELYTPGGAVRAESLLLRGDALSEAELWISRRPREAPEPSELHREYVKASRTAEHSRLAAEREQLNRMRRFQRRAGWSLGGVAVLVILGGIGAAVTYREMSVRESRVFTSKASDAFAAGNLPLAMRYAVAGLPAPGTLPLDYWSHDLEKLLSTIAARYTPLLSEISDFTPYYNSGVEVDPTGKRAFVRGANQAVLWDTDDGRSIRTIPLHGGTV
jgi:hypothetical protein